MRRGERRCTAFSCTGPNIHSSRSKKWMPGTNADPRSFCIQKTLQDIAHGGPIDQNLMFAGHAAYRFKQDPGELKEWFHRGAARGSLPMYLEGFAHTTSVMQTEEALERVAYEMMEDMHRDGVVYVETRFAPVFHGGKGLHGDEVVTAVLTGLERGKKDFGVEYGVIICAMRNLQRSLEMAELAVDFRERGVAPAREALRR